MRSIERLEQQKRVKQQKKKNEPSPDWEMEEELEYPKFIPLNRNKTAFSGAEGGPFGGINSAPSVFHRTAVFPND